jgi:hypothetical protein
LLHAVASPSTQIVRAAHPVSHAQSVSQSGVVSHAHVALP